MSEQRDVSNFFNLMDLESLDLDDEDLRFDSKDLLLENIVAEFGLVSAQN